MLNAATPEPATGKTRGKPRGPNKHPGIVRHARALGVSYTHLYRVLVGERRSPLLQRYQALVAAERSGGQAAA